MVQIGGYLTPDEHADFKLYAAAYQLKESSLANLLIARELRQNRLGKLRQRFLPNAPLKNRSRVTAHADARVKDAFEQRAQATGISPDQAASVVFRAELSERWLEKCVASALESD